MADRILLQIFCLLVKVFVILTNCCLEEGCRHFVAVFFMYGTCLTLIISAYEKVFEFLFGGCGFVWGECCLFRAVDGG